MRSYVEPSRAAHRAGRAVLSEDETVGAVAAIVPRNSRNDIDIIGTAQAVRKLQADFRQRFPRIEVLMTGRLMMDNAFLVDGQDETFFYAGVQIVVLALVLLVTFLSAIAAAMLMAMVLTAALTTVGATGWIGFPLNGISSAAPSVLLGLAVAIAVHLVMAWQAARRRGLNQQEAVASAIGMNLVPVTLSVLTTMASFLCLNFAASPPFRQLGNVVTCGLVLTYVASFTLLPALLLSLPSGIAYRGLPLEPALARLGGGSSAAGALCSSPLRLRRLPCLRASRRFGPTTPSRIISMSASRFRRATDLFEEKLSGTIFVDFAVPVAGGEEAFGPAHLERVEAFTAWLMARPEVADVLSLSSFAGDLAARVPAAVVRAMPPPRALGPPGARPAAQARSMLPIAYEAARREGLIGLVDAAGHNSRVNVVLRGVSSADTLAFVRAAEAKAAEIFGGPVLATGLPRLSAQLSLDSSKAMVISMVFTLASVSLLLLVSLRDVRLGLISLAPNLVPILAAFGIWGFWVGEVSFAATVVGALTFGIIVDDTVHILVKYRLLRREGHEPGAAVVNTFRSVGIAVIATSAALAASFAVFTFSGFLVNQHLGWLTAIVITAALIADSVLAAAARPYVREACRRRSSGRSSRPRVTLRPPPMANEDAGSGQGQDCFGFFGTAAFGSGSHLGAHGIATKPVRRLSTEAVWKRFGSCRLLQVICGGRSETFHRRRGSPPGNAAS